MISIDWLTVYQDSPEGDYPIFGSTDVWLTDIETGEIETRYVKPKAAEGSYATKLQISCDGCRLRISGNPSRFGRLDNLFGVSDVSEAFRVFNAVLASLSLPQLEETDSPTYLAPRLTAHGSTPMVRGPVITRIDLCANLAVGSGNERTFLRAVHGVAYRGRLGHLYADGGTVDWMRGSRNVYLKYYAKALEMNAHRARKSTLRTEEHEYRNQVQSWCEKQGIVRVEVSLKSLALRKRGLERPEQWSKPVMAEILNLYRLDRHIEDHGESPGIADALEQKGVQKRDAVKAEAHYLAWRQGADLRAAMSRRQWYYVRNRLLRVGVDIASSPSSATLPISMRRITVREAVAPTWYRAA